MSESGALRTVVVGDALLPTELISEAFQLLRERVELTAALTWGPPDQTEVDRMALHLERDGPTAEEPPGDLTAALSQAELLVVHYCPVPPALLDAAPHLRILATCRAGTENIAAAEAMRRGLLVLHVIGRTTEAVSDFAVGLLLSEVRNIARAHHRVVDGTWDKEFRTSAFTPELEGKTVGIVGFGEIGRAVARKLGGFRVRLLVYDPFVEDHAVRERGAEPAPLEHLLEESDFVTLHARPTPEAPPLIGTDELAMMKPTAFLVNTARAALVDTPALIAALDRGAIAGAALDVHDQEPLPADHPLLRLDNVTLTPHLASSTKECSEKSPRILAEDLRRLLEGEHPRHALQPAGGGTVLADRGGSR
jgi:D-3-phosphoglycerate dehydrogenase / 2-oxoglutarate reductase